MGLLDQLWDDTVAGPRPENGLGKLRKYKTLSFPSNSDKGSSPSLQRSISTDGGNLRPSGEVAAEEPTKVTRSIMIVKPPGYGNGYGGSPPISPAGSTPPISPAGSTPPVSPFLGKHMKCPVCPFGSLFVGPQVSSNNGAM